MKRENLSQEEIGTLFAHGTPEESPQPAPFPTLVPSAVTDGDSTAIGLLASVELEVTVQLGQTSRSIREILSYGPGSVLELDRVAGEAVDILINGRLVAKGEVVVIGENFGVRVTDLVSVEGGAGK